jgi:hypothetical protein
LWLVPVGFCLVLVRLWLGVAREDFALGRILAIEETMQQPFPSAEGSPTAADILELRPELS